MQSQSRILVGYQFTKDEDDQDCFRIFAMQEHCPAFWGRNIYGNKEVSARDLAKDAESRILANPERFMEDPDNFLPRGFGKQVKKDKE